MTFLPRIVEQLEGAAANELDAGIDRCLQLLGLELELTIVSLVERTDDQLVVRFQWRANGYMDPAFELALDRAGWWSDHVSEREDVVIDELGELPESASFERDYLSSRSTASLAAIATSWRSDLFLIAEVLSAPRPWTSEALELLTGASRHLGVALSRQAERRALEAETARVNADNQTKNAFIATLAHELRTPLTGILGYAQLLQSDAAGTLLPKQRHLVNDILSCAEHLARIVSESLAYGQLEANRMPLDLDEIDLRDVVHIALATIEPRVLDSGLELQIDMPAELISMIGDSVKLSQVLINLLSNAVKFTSEGSISLAVRPSETEVEIAVSDTGLGIAPGDLERIFESFARVHRPRGQKGTGLGLALVKRMVELHEGRVEVESVRGAGSCFTVTLPRRPLGSKTGRSAYVGRVV